MIKVGIIGGSGYTGIELIRLLLMHPKVEIAVVTSRRYKGNKISEINPYLYPFTELEYEDVDMKEIVDRSDVVFTAVPHGNAMKYVPELLERGTRVIDISADYRLNKEKYEEVYKRRHTDEKAASRGAVYGLTELYSEMINSATLIANPGCYPTGAILAVIPLVKDSFVKKVVFDAKSGISGGGMEPSEMSHFPNLAENIIPYEITTHRHTAEIKKELAGVEVSFTPHVIPCIRGILTTAHVFMSKKNEKGVTSEELYDIYKRFYEGKRFIRLMKKRKPSLSNIRGSNFCDLGFEVEENSDRIVIISAIDNLIKGGAGQAIQNMNMMFGMKEEEGLLFPGLSP